jgi:signal peptidase
MFRYAGAHATRKPKGRLASGILFLAVIAAAAVVLGSATGRWRIVPVLSGSMQPAINAGDLALVVPQPVADVRPGQVIVYAIPIGDRHVEIHRVVHVSHGPLGTDVVTEGDANSSPDPWTARLNGPRVWRVSSSVRWLGYAVLFIGRPAVRIACLLLGVALLLAVGLRWIWSAPPPRAGPVPIGAVDGDP